MKTVHQYYYRDNQCSTNSANDDGCICWHDEGTGPWPDVKYVGNNGNWRTKEVMTEEEKTEIKKAWAEGKQVQYITENGWVNWQSQDFLNLLTFHDWRVAPKRENVWVKVYYRIDENGKVKTTNLELNQYFFTTDYCDLTNKRMLDDGHTSLSDWMCIPGDYSD